MGTSIKDKRAEEKKAKNKKAKEKKATKKLARIIRGVFKNAGKVVSRIESITPHSFVVATKRSKKSKTRVTWAPRFVIVHMPQEYPPLIEAFNLAIGLQPFCRYIKYGQLVFEWDMWDRVDASERLIELEKEEKLKRIDKLERVGIRNIN